ncbi:MAG: hypothetical protein HBSAPP04_00570 [Ignavibacteriaceae bacterium]|nr:MAG: hypothetical protein HBSAPP04_00570 [Ignavibacteriaceae bacterium]
MFNKIVLVCFLFTPVFAQDFLPNYYWNVRPATADDGSGSEYNYIFDPVHLPFSSDIRERMLPYYIREIKKQGVSKEIHTDKNTVVANYYYNPDGLLTKFESKLDYTEKLFEYDSNNRLKSVVVKGDESASRLDFTRDSLGRISTASTGTHDFLYAYDNAGKFESIFNEVPRIKVVFRKNNELTTPGITLAAYADSTVYDKYGRTKVTQFGFDANGSSAEFDKKGRLASESSFARSIGNTYSYTYTNGLITKILLETFNNLSRNTTKTVTNVKYEYRHKQKK